MDGQWSLVLNAVSAVFLMIALGASLRRFGLLTRHADETLLKVIVRVLVPALILHVIVGNRRMTEPANLVLPPVVGFVTVVGGIALAYLVARLLKGALGLNSPAAIRTFALGVGLYNYAYVPLPLIERLYDANLSDKATQGVLFVHNLGVEVAMWTVGVVLVSGHFGRDLWKRVLNPPVLAIIVALALNLSGLHRYWPGFLAQISDMLGRSAIPLSLLLTGAMIADAWSSSRLSEGLRTIAAAASLRLLVLPAAFLVLAWLIPGPSELKRVIVVQAAMPSAVFPIVLARVYGGDVPTAVRVCVGTSLLGLATLPLWLWAGRVLVGV
jgi:predicted permease